ncbi:MAG: hypothetical protein LBI94_04465 [Treponema sp.]|jgi:hypothetical protein|nr:hypothetical protein [Treponema sp.]
MIDGVLIDTFNLQARQFAVRWKALIRKSPHLKQYNALDDEALIESDMAFYPLLARTLSRGLDRSVLGGFFAELGKKRMNDGFPISEIIYAVNLAQEVVIEYIMTDYAPENPVRMYQSMGVMMKVSEFFLLGCFYLTKGFLEATYTHMNSQDNVSKDLLNKYFRDDFFFKQG